MDEILRRLYRYWQASGADEDFRRWVRAAQRAGVKLTMSGEQLGQWEETTEEDYEYALNAVPPAHMWLEGFILGERYSSTLGGETVWVVYQKHRDRIYSIITTRADLNQHLAQLRSRSPLPSTLSHRNPYYPNPLPEIPEVDKLTPDILNDWSDGVKEELDLWVFSLSLFPSTWGALAGDIVLDSIIVKPEDLHQGKGTIAMQQLCDLADHFGVRIWLSPGTKDDYHGTTSRRRLVRFYKRFGFVENKGRNKDFRSRQLMYRKPNKM